MTQDYEKLEAVICQLLATVSAEKDARRKALRQPIGQPLDGRSFPSRDEMVKSHTFAALDLDVELPNLMSAAVKLPKPYGDMLCYLAYKDLHERMRTYQKLAEELVQQDDSTLLTAMPDAGVVAA
jgi:hypothetical protein